MTTQNYDVAVIGGGIVGLATAYSLGQQGVGSIGVIEAEPRIATHQTGHNSGVIHSGLYYRPGSLRARNCVEGREALYRFCAENNIRHERCGKIVAAVDEGEIPALQELHRRGEANGLRGLAWLDGGEVRKFEPHLQAFAGLHVPETGIVDFPQVAQVLAEKITDAGGSIRTRTRMLRAKAGGRQVQIATNDGNIIAGFMVACAGLYSDRVARRSGLRPPVKIIPFRGEYYDLIPPATRLVRNLIYPVPDPRFPFLGVHFTRTVHGAVEAGPNAVLALSREGYRWRDVKIADLFEMACYRGFWRFVLRYPLTGMQETYRSLSKRAFHRSLQRLIPELRIGDIRRGGSGVRAQAVSREGKLLDDFEILESERMVHVLNAPSPAATACLAIGKTVAERVVALMNRS